MMKKQKLIFSSVAVTVLAGYFVVCPAVWAQYTGGSGAGAAGAEIVPEELSTPSGEAASGQEANVVKPVEVNGDKMEFFREENKVVIDGHVSVIKGDTELKCDRVEYFHLTKKALAKGHVVLLNPQGSIFAQDLVFNFETMTGNFSQARVLAPPYYGAGETIAKVSKDKMEMSQGYMTTCDLDKPHYKLFAKKVDIYPGEKVTARSMRMVVGKVPILFIPQYTQVINDKKPRVIYTPGYDKDWGVFLLTAWRYYFHENFRGNLLFDIREKKDVAAGFHNKYKIPGFGEGSMKTYYMNERNVKSKRWFLERPEPTIERERFKAEWRHQWQIDETAQAVLQYYKLSDNQFLEDYFERESDTDANPDTYFLFTKNYARGTLSFRTDKRVNRFESTLERLPEIGYTLSNQEMGGTGFYLQSENLYSNFSYPAASPSEVRKSTFRVDTRNAISLPKRIAFIDFTPYVGQRETYYSRTKESSRYDVVRSAFETGANLMTKFYKTLDVPENFLGMDVHGMRHVISPAIDYQYVNDPTIPDSSLDSYDSIDALTRSHKVTLSIQNKLQTKRLGNSVDLLRVDLDTPFGLKEDPGKGSFDTVNSDLEFRPVEWITFYNDMSYSCHREKLISANFDLYINAGDQWAFSLGKRYSLDVDDQVTGELTYMISPKWRLKVYDRFDIDGGGQKEQEIVVTRDLHCWEMDMAYNETRGEGSEVWIVFRLKAFPDLTLDLFTTGFNKRKAGSQTQ